MKVLRIAALGVALVVGSSVAAMAQGGPPGAGGRGGRGNMLMVGIDSTLSPDQKAKLAEITAKYAPETQAIRDAMQGGGDRAEGMKKMGELRAKMAPEIRAVLTAEQQVVYDKNSANMKAAAEARAKAAPPAI